jgi:hypothetical protein
MVRLLKEKDVNIEVKNEGILEVPEGKNVDDLPMSHFEKLAKKKGLSKITKALNNLQVWNKNDDPKLSKWAGSMIDKLNKKLKKESFRLRESTKPFVTIEDAARYYFDNWYNGFITNDEIRRNLRRNGYSDDFISDVFEFISELSDDADEYWDDIDESLNEADYAGYYDPFDYQTWKTVHIDKDKKQAFIDGIHKLGLEWKLGHFDRKSDKVELRIFATQDELAELADIADAL